MRTAQGENQPFLWDQMEDGHLTLKMKVFNSYVKRSQVSNCLQVGSSYWYSCLFLLENLGLSTYQFLISKMITHGSLLVINWNAKDLEHIKEKLHRLVFARKNANMSLRCLFLAPTTLVKIDAKMVFVSAIVKRILKMMVPVSELIVKDIGCIGTKSGVSIALILNPINWWHMRS